MSLKADFELMARYSQWMNARLYVFIHQTHHRGQVTPLFSQLGLDVGVTDLSALIAEL